MMTACGSNYHHNYVVEGPKVKEKTRTYYGGVPEVVQVSEHHFIDWKVLDLFTGLMLLSW
jgi:hypothetical protein